MQEKRGFERMVLDGHMYIKTRGKNPLTLRVFLDDFSFGGFAVYSPEKLKKGRVIEFNLITQVLDQGLVGKAKIRHVSQPPECSTPLYTIGAQFLEVNKDLVTYIINRIQAKMVLQMQARKEVAEALDFMVY